MDLCGHDGQHNAGILFGNLKPRSWVTESLAISVTIASEQELLCICIRHRLKRYLQMHWRIWPGAAKK